MKKTVTICILSLSLCLIQAASLPDVHPAGASTATNDTKASETAKTEIYIVTTETSSSPNKPVNPKVEPKPADIKPQQDTKPADTKQDIKPIDNKSTDNTKNETVPKPAVEPPKNTDNGTKPAGKAEASTQQTVTVKPSEAPKNVTEKPTEAPKDVTEKPIHAERGFSGPSFIGGIILTLGLLAIGFMGFKYYKNQTERNYHTL